METKHLLIKPDDKNNNEHIINEAATLLQDGELVAIPTETVYGLGADATNEEAVSKIFEAKGRPQDNPLIAHVANLQQLKMLVGNVPEYVEELIEVYSPGPLTYVLPTSGVSAKNVTAGLSTIAVRIPDHEVALEIIRSSNLPIAAPSANLSGKPSPTTAQHVFEDLSGKIAGIVDAGPTGIGVESTVIACHEKHVVILRPGGITKEEIEKIVPVRDTDNFNTEKPASPGMKYRHYSPEVPLWLVTGDHAKIQTVIQKAQQDGKIVTLLSSDAVYQQVQANQKINLGTDLSEIAANLYEALRKCKASEVDLIVAEAFPESGLGTAIMNRLKKAMTKYIQE